MAKKKSGLTDLAKREERLAYWLLIPTFFIIVVIAFYPLGSVFVNSFTNKIFASAEPTEFVGIDNYKQLLSVTIKELPPVIDEATGQPAIDPETGEVQYERAINILPREPNRYREVTQFSLFGKHFSDGRRGYWWRPDTVWTSCHQRASSSSWVTTRIVLPSATKPSNNLKTESAVLESRLPVGSSARMTGGRIMVARAMATR